MVLLTIGSFISTVHRLTDSVFLNLNIGGIIETIDGATYYTFLRFDLNWLVYLFNHSQT